MAIETWHLFKDDLSPELQWRLLDWCVAHGGTECSIGGIVADGASDVALRPVDELLKPFRRPSAERRVLTPSPGGSYLQVRELFELNQKTLEAVRLAFQKGPFYGTFLLKDLPPPKGLAWFEDVYVYRAGELLLGVVSLEGEGVLRVAAEERAGLTSLGIVLRDAGRYVSYKS